MINALTIDLEDYFQVHAFSKVIRYEDWDKFESRIERNTDLILKILNSVSGPILAKPQHHSNSALNDSSFITHNSEFKTHHSQKGTFFVLGWIAERYPDLVRRIQKEGHEIACHGYGHQLIYNQSRDEFRQDVKRAKSILEEITGSEVMGYRAPSYSITGNSKWAFEILVEEGFKYDSSIFPIRHDFYGMPEAPRFPFVIFLNGNSNVEFSVMNCKVNTFQNSKLKIQNSKFLMEFPISTMMLFGQNIPVSGGGYFRLFPYPIIEKGLKSINEKEGKPFIFYLHPWEIDPQQPRINGLSSRSKFRHYVNLGKTVRKFRKLLKDFNFSSVKKILELNNLIT
jgi:polysaccharide deacetylase family protein (PEP-CTERM system associated)